jgi:hypothetical protein
MVADNDEFNDLMTILMVATYVKGWTGIDTQLRRAGGYITVDCAETLRDAVNDLERQHDLPDGVAWLELFIACSKRLRLDEETEKNSASPSPSGTTPPASNETKASEPAGTSPASASSSETPAAA